MLFQPRFWSKPTIVGWLLVGAYLASRFSGLTSLPVFADEAIYIRWAQLIVHEPSRYAFFSLNDGKPPLFIWSLLPALSVISDPLWAARAVSALIGLGQLFLSDWLIRQFRGGPLARLAAALTIIIAPFWFFHHRMALVDGLLTLGLTLSLVGLTKLHFRPGIGGLILTGIGWGLALWTKTPALFFAPIFVLFAFGGPIMLDQKPISSLTILAWLKRVAWFAAAGLLGLVIFGLLRSQPTFGSLFSRSGDFTFTTSELLSGSWQVSVDNISRLVRWLSAYLRPELLSLSVIALVVSHHHKRHWFWWLGAVIFAAPLVLYGRTLHPRYFLPMAPFLTLSAGLFTEEAWEMVQRAKDSIFQTVFMVLVAFFTVGSLRFALLNIFSPSQIPFVLEDREQYLTTWASGHGLPEVRHALLERARRGERTTVVTEGSFGTLPDGLLMYFDRAPEIKYLRIEGLDQYPVKFLPTWVKEEAKQHETWLVVNQDRMEVPTDEVELLARYERPYGAPELRVYRVKPIL